MRSNRKNIDTFVIVRDVSMRVLRPSNLKTVFYESARRPSAYDLSSRSIVDRVTESRDDVIEGRILLRLILLQQAIQTLAIEL